jgi:hypothetical protein
MVGRSRPAQAWSSSTAVGSSASIRRQRTFREGVAFSTVPLRLSYLDLLTHTCISWLIRGRAPLPGWPTTPTTTVTGVIEQTVRGTLSSGVTTVRDLGDSNYAVMEWRTQHAGAVAPTIVASGPPITTPRGHCANMGGEAAGPVALRAAVRERAARGADLIKIMASGGAMTAGTSMTHAQYSVEDLAVVVAEAHDAGLTVTAHAHPLAAIRDAITAGVDGAMTVLFAQVYLPDAWGYTKPLHREANDGKAAANRAAICDSTWVPDPTVATDSCDEYAFAATKESGGNVGLRGSDCADVKIAKDASGKWVPTAYKYTGTERCVRAHVPTSENTAVGGELGRFTVANRLLDNDAYTVNVH